MDTQSFSSFYTSQSQSQSFASEEDSFRWVFHGNIIIPTGNPFQESQPSGEDHEDSEIGSSSVKWLGPGLKLCQNYVLAVDHDGFIVHLAHEHFLDLRYYRRKRSYVRLGPHEFLCPGFIDTHVHAPQFAYTGTATDRPLMGKDGWLERYTFPAEHSLKEDSNKARHVYEAVVRTTLQAGTTTALYFATLDIQPCQILVETALNLGQRALVGKVCMDRNSPSFYCQSTQQNLEETERLIQYIQKRAGRMGTRRTLPLILPVVTPRFIPTCSPQLLSSLSKMAQKYNCHIQSHISESPDEVAFTQQVEQTTKTDAEIFDMHKLLTPKCVMAHGVFLSDSDLYLLEQRGTAISHCPLSNFFFAESILPCRKILERGNKVGLGTDVAGGYSPSLMSSQRTAVIASRAYQQQYQKYGAHEKKSHERGENHVLDYRHAFYMATLGGAEALGLSDRIGTFSVGMELDAIILSASVPSSQVHVFDTDNIEDVFQKLCNLGDDRNVKRVFVQGKEVVFGDNILLEI